MKPKPKKNGRAGLQHQSSGKPTKRVIGRPFPKGVSGNPSGRRSGSVSPTAALKRALTRHDAELIAKKLIVLAKQGDPGALKILLDRCDGPLNGPLAIATAFAAASNEASSQGGGIAQVIIMDNGRDPAGAGADAGMVQRVAEPYRLPAADTAPEAAVEPEESSEPEANALPAVLSGSEFLQS